MTCSSHHPDYDKAAKRWDLVRSVVNNDAKKWLRTIDFSDRFRSAQYKQDAILTNFTALTKVGLTGLVFRRDPKIDLPSCISYLEDDATGDNFPLIQMAQAVVGEVLETGRHGILVDYPLAQGVVSLLDEQQAENVARLKMYKAESIINWKAVPIGAKTMLSMVVLEEIIDTTAEDGFMWVQKKQYRVLRLDENQRYNQDIYDQDCLLQSTYLPLRADGTCFNEIPFCFIGSENNDAAVDNIPLYDLAVITLGHYRNSADLEEAIFLCGQPTLFMHGEGSIEEFKSAYPDGVKFGSRAGYYFGPGSGAQLLQASPNQMVDVAMKRKEEQAVALGARLIAPPGGRETATSARIRFASQNSALYNVTSNIGDAMIRCLQWACQFMSKAVEQVNFSINSDFYEETADAGLISAQIMMLDRGIIAKEDIRNYGRKTGLIEEDRTDAELDAESEIIDPLQGVQDSPVQVASADIGDTAPK